MSPNRIFAGPGLPKIEGGGKRLLVLLLAHTAMVQIVTFAIRPALSYGVLDLSDSAVIVGMLAATFALPALALALPAGVGVDRWGERPILILGSAFLLFASLIATLGVHSLELLLISTAVLGGGHILSVIGGQTLVGNLAPGGKHDRRFGHYSLAVSGGQALGPLILLLPGETNLGPPVQLVALACVVGSVLTVGLAWALANSGVSKGTGNKKILRTSRLIIRIPGMGRALLTSGLMVASIDIFVAFVPALGVQRSISVDVVAAMLIVRALASMAARTLLPTLVSYFGRKTVLVSSVVFSVVGLLVMVVPLGEIGLIFASVIYGFAVGVAQPITITWVFLLAPIASRGLALSNRLAGNRVGQTAIPLLVGLLAASSGAAGVFALTSLTLVGAIWASWAVPPNETDGQEQSTV